MLVPARALTCRGILCPMKQYWNYYNTNLTLLYNYCETIVKQLGHYWNTIMILFTLMFNYWSDPFNFDTSGLFTPMYHWSSGPVTTCDQWPVTTDHILKWFLFIEARVNQINAFPVLLRHFIGVAPNWPILAYCQEFQNYNMMMKSMNVLYDHADDPTRIKSFCLWKVLKLNWIAQCDLDDNQKTIGNSCGDLFSS